MKIQLLTLAGLLGSGTLLAQTPQEALRLSWYVPNQSARSTAVGGVMGSLGGDISAANVNPAGLGFYRFSEVVLSPGFGFNNNLLNYRGKDTSGTKNAFQYGPIGIVAALDNDGGGVKGQALSITVTQVASFNNRLQYRGFNNQSSYSEQYLEELVRDRADSNAALSNYIFGSSLAFRTYLIDKLTTPTGQLTGYKALPNVATGVNQEYDANTRGGIHDITLGYGADLDGKWMLGGSLSVPIASYRRDLTFTERDATQNKTNNFNYSTYTENFRSNGVGVGLKFGAIYRPTQYVRLGLAVHSPSWMFMRDQIRSSMTTDTEGYAGVVTETSDNLNSGAAGERRYMQSTPWKAVASASYVFRETANTKRQRAFLSADIEYVDYASSRFTAFDDNDEVISGYYDATNDATKNLLKGAFNFKAGGELKFDPFMVRAGAAYYSSPYRESELKSDRLVLSGGVGWRYKGIFLDLTYAHQVINDVQFPYLLNDVANTYATNTGSRGTAVVTLGFKL